MSSLSWRGARRRDAIALLASSALTWPIAAPAQPSRTYRLAILTLAAPLDEAAEAISGFFRELRRSGYEEGKNLTIKRLSADGQTDRHGGMVREAVEWRPDVILAVGLRFMRLLKEAQVPIPVVGITSDPVAHGLVASLSHPGGSMTGVSLDAGIEVLGKRLEYLKEIAPHITRVGYLAPLPGWEGLHQQTMQAVAERSSVALFGPPLQSPIQEPEYRRVLASMALSLVDAVFVSDYGENYTSRRVIAELAAEHKFPTMHPYRGYVDVGGLMEYAIEFTDLFQHAANLISRILKGEHPGTIPFVQPTKFVLRINSTVAKALGLTIPPTLLARADEVIE
jgi:putative tryptophan/tyrosine transport system substrate-binding protein